MANIVDNFYYVEGSASVKDLVLGLTTEFVAKSKKSDTEDYRWEVAYPKDIAIDEATKTIVNGATVIKNNVILSTHPSFLGDPTDISNPNKDKKFYLRLSKDPQSLTYMNMQIGERIREFDPHIKVYIGSIPVTEEAADYMPESRIEDYLTTTSAVIDLAGTLSTQDIECTTIFPKKVYAKSIKLYATDIDTGEITGEAIETLAHTSHYDFVGSDYIFDADTLATLKATGTLADGTYALVFECDLVGLELDPAYSGPLTRMAWYTTGKLDSFVKEWLPVQYWININADCVNMILRGDPSVDVYPYNNYIMSYSYIGGIKKIEDDPCAQDAGGYNPEDLLGNFGLTCSSDIEPVFSRKFGLRTGTGTTDIMMAKTKSGMPYQAHLPAYYATTNFMDKMNLEGSRWNDNKHQFSEITLVHSVDMERGKLQNVLIGDGSSITNLDKLAFKRSTEDEEMYRKFTITAPFWLMNSGTNNLYSVAIRCYRDFVEAVV